MVKIVDMTSALQQVREKKADFLRLNFANNQTVKKAERWLYNNLGHSNPGYTSIIADKNSIEFQDMNDADSVMTKLKRAGFNFKVDMRESKAYMLSYGKKGEKAKFFYGNSLSDIQKKAHELRKQGIVVDKMGRTEPTHKLRQTIEAVNPDDKGEKQNADKVKSYTDPKGGEKSVIKPLQELEKECPQCQGKGCDHCDGKGYHMKEDNSNDKSDDGEGMDKVQPKAVKKKFDDRKDKDIDNDGDEDESDEYLHRRRKAISKALED